MIVLREVGLRAPFYSLAKNTPEIAYVPYQDLTLKVRKPTEEIVMKMNIRDEYQRSSLLIRQSDLV